MKLSIGEARKRLPELVRRVRKRNGAKVEITVHDGVVAELRATMLELKIVDAASIPPCDSSGTDSIYQLQT